MQYSASNPLVRNDIFLHFIMVITVLWAELWFVVARCNLAESVGIVHILIRINVGYFRYIEQEREDILVASTVYSTSWKFCNFFDQNTLIGCVKLACRDFWWAKLLDFAGSLLVCYLWWMNEGGLLILSVLIYSNRWCGASQCGSKTLKMLHFKSF